MNKNINFLSWFFYYRRVWQHFSKILFNPPSHLAHNFHHPEVRVSAGQSGILHRRHWRLMLRRRIVITKLDDWMSPARRFLINDGGKWRFSDRHHFYVAVCVCVRLYFFTPTLSSANNLYWFFLLPLPCQRKRFFSFSAFSNLFSYFMCLWVRSAASLWEAGKTRGWVAWRAGKLWGRLRKNNDNQVRSLSVSPLWRPGLAKEKETIFALSRSGCRGGGQGAKENNFPSSRPFVFPSIPRIFPWVSFFFYHPLTPHFVLALAALLLIYNLLLFFHSFLDVLHLLRGPPRSGVPLVVVSPGPADYPWRFFMDDEFSTPSRSSSSYSHTHS